MPEHNRYAARPMNVALGSDNRGNAGREDELAAFKERARFPPPRRGRLARVSVECASTSSAGVPFTAGARHRAGEPAATRG
ncbi:MAG: hypothetical protein AVDCRST_MAG64-2306 [uncultured Phycisphaerae bacterium]|uniref:Uncharacterized protein n=1 Tax=uncultured Phycisphaerae bacterium TaxID=904963 RepID=A0A6J4PEN4_9BACT|nr:MAG: hypothetical protein AVDCRST_MAG64-2306 [uncultured Phycisphaerae bacterium]